MSLIGSLFGGRKQQEVPSRKAQSRSIAAPKNKLYSTVNEKHGSNQTELCCQIERSKFFVPSRHPLLLWTQKLVIEKNFPMGVLAKISRRVFPFRHGVKDGLTMVTTAEEENAASTSATTMNSDDDVDICRQCIAEPLSPHHGTILTAPVPQSRGAHAFFSDDFDQKLYNDEDDDTIMGSMILLHASNCSSGSSSSFEDGNRDALTSPLQSDPVGTIPNYDGSILEDVKAKIDIVEEPSFEISLMEDSREVPPSPLKNLSLAFKIPRKNSSSSSHLGPRPEHRSLKPQKRFDQYGRPFVHVYTEGLSTLYELNESTPIHGVDQAPHGAMTEVIDKEESDDLQLQARWTLASHQMKHEDKECECNTSSSRKGHSKWYQSIVSPRNGP